MEGDMTRIRRWLKPLSWLYGAAVDVRNALFDMGVLPSVSYDIPVISVGNITVGGTGKTPHVEYLIRLLSKRYRVAVLSRGYKRRTRGYLLASAATTMEEIGDMVGFSNRQSFYASFYKITGKSPRAYRKEHEERLGNKK